MAHWHHGGLWLAVEPVHAVGREAVSQLNSTCMTSSDGTRMVTGKVGDPVTTIAHYTLEGVLILAARLGTSPVCHYLGPLGQSEPLYAAIVAAQDASGQVQAVWESEPMFRSPQAALEHAETLVEPESWLNT